MRRFKRHILRTKDRPVPYPACFPSWVSRVMAKIAPRVDVWILGSQGCGDKAPVPSPVGGGDALLPMLAPWAGKGVGAEPGPFKIYSSARRNSTGEGWSDQQNKLLPFSGPGVRGALTTKTITLPPTPQAPHWTPSRHIV